jgi:hypothetical protein
MFANPSRQLIKTYEVLVKCGIDGHYRLDELKVTSKVGDRTDC